MNYILCKETKCATEEERVGKIKLTRNVDWDNFVSIAPAKKH